MLQTPLMCPPLHQHHLGSGLLVVVEFTTHFEVVLLSLTFQNLIVYFGLKNIFRSFSHAIVIDVDEELQQMKQIIAFILQPVYP